MPSDSGQSEKPQRPRRRRAGDIVRTVVIGVSTLAILLVCYSFYQYQSSLDEGAVPRQVGPRLPDLGARSEMGAGNPLSGSGADAGRVAVGPGRDIRLTLFRPNDDRSWGEIAVQEWTPVEGAADEFRLKRPEFRMRTRDGHGVLVTADEATLETQRRRGSDTGGWEVRRGRLTGSVVVDYDRLTLDERQRLPEERRGEVRPEEVVRIRTDELRFDVEYAQLSVPGEIDVDAVDAQFETSGLEVHFDEAQGRVEYLRMDSGGNLKLLEAADQPVVGLPGEEGGGERRRSLVTWIRESLKSQIEAAARRKAAEAQAKAAPTPRPSFDEDGTPIIYLDEEPAVSKSQAPPRYYARFEEDIDARRINANESQTRLEAQVLEVVRTLSLDDQERAERAERNKPGESAAPAAGPGDAGRIELSWKGRLVVRTCGKDDAICAEAGSSYLAAEGDPVRVLDEQGEARCESLRFDADRFLLDLRGSEEVPVDIHSSTGRNLRGVAVRWSQDGDRFHVEVDGPGSLERAGDASGFGLNGIGGGADEEAAEVDSSAVGVKASGGPVEPSIIRFSKSFIADGQRVRKMSVDWKRQQLVEKQCTELSTAELKGAVNLVDGETTIGADEMDVRFAAADSECKQFIDHVNGQGDVLLKQEGDRLACGAIDLELRQDVDERLSRKLVPVRAELSNDIEVTQTGRTIRASEKLIADFVVTERLASPLSSAEAYRLALAEGLDPNAMDWPSFLRSHELRREREVGVRRIRARGDVHVTDPDTGLDVRAEDLDAGFVEGREIERVRVLGNESTPATIATANWSVTGKDVRADMPADEAEVSGAGRMTFRSYKDLDGSESSEPIPIAVQWDRWMRYDGAQNRAVYAGAVHAASSNQTTFDCPDELVLQFEDVASPAAASNEPEWKPILEAWDVIRSVGKPRKDVNAPAQLNKKLTYVLAKGGARVHTAQVDKATGELRGRATLTGPKLSLDLRPEVTKMLIEGPGELLLEDFRRAKADGPSSPEQGRGDRGDDLARPAIVSDRARAGRDSSGGLLSFDANAGPSKTLIEWKEYLSYDYAIRQTRFEGKVRLVHFSGAALDEVLGRGAGPTGSAARGRRTFLSSDVLTADFLGGENVPGSTGRNRMGDLSAESLRQFRAVGNVSLQDEIEGLDVSCADLIYERQRQILFIQGAVSRRAAITLQRPGQAPRQFTGDRFVYDLASGVLEVHEPAFQGR
ncbi:MAG: hypothetical protein J5J06_11440 [Phycisphaerae bacterium]|nr:hypothetical protein [Phycisphaerae bacterium]